MNFILLVPVLVLVLSCVGGARTAKCPDGTNGLTKELYEAGDPSVYADVTCVPESEFSKYNGDVYLTGLQNLTSFEKWAFKSMSGKLFITGEYPLLESIGVQSFRLAGNVHSTIDLSRGLPSLKVIFDWAFNYFPGKLFDSYYFLHLPPL